MGIKETIEKNTMLWFLGALLTAFLAGIGAFEGTLRITGQTVYSKGKFVQTVEELEAYKKKERCLFLFLR